MNTGTDLRDQGVADVLAADTAPHRGYGQLCSVQIETLAATGVVFTAEDVRAAVTAADPDAQPHSPNVLPACMAGAARAGLIRTVGYTAATRQSRHASVIRTWTGA